MLIFRTQIRMTCVCFAALAVSFPVAIISLSKLVLLMVCVIVLMSAWLQGTVALLGGAPVLARRTWAVPVSLLAMALVGASALWTTAPLEDAWFAWDKHAKLVLIPALWVLIRSRREAQWALSVLLCGQVFLLVCSCLMAMGAELPWLMSSEPREFNVVFSTRLDQPIMTSVLGGLCAVLAPRLPGTALRPWALGVAALAWFNVLFLMQSRTAYLLVLSQCVLLFWWFAPREKRLKLTSLGTVFLLGLALTLPGVRQRVDIAINELTAYRAQEHVTERNSSAERLDFWARSLQAVAERPWLGFGMGSWNQQYLRLGAGRTRPDQMAVRSPHQEFLLWGVEAGVAGMLCLLAVFAALLADARSMAPTEKQALQLAVASLMVCCMFNATLFDALIGDFFCVLIGVLLAWGSFTRNHPMRPAHPT